MHTGTVTADEDVWDVTPPDEEDEENNEDGDNEYPGVTFIHMVIFLHPVRNRNGG